MVTGEVRHHLVDPHSPHAKQEQQLPEKGERQMPWSSRSENVLMDLTADGECLDVLPNEEEGLWGDICDW